MSGALFQGDGWLERHLVFERARFWGVWSGDNMEVVMSYKNYTDRKVLNVVVHHGTGSHA